jgi:hypothetical protein
LYGARSRDPQILFKSLYDCDSESLVADLYFKIRIDPAEIVDRSVP